VYCYISACCCCCCCCWIFCNSVAFSVFLPSSVYVGHNEKRTVARYVFCCFHDATFTLLNSKVSSHRHARCELENCPRLRIEVPPPVLWPLTLTFEWFWHVTLTFNPRRAMIMTHTHVKGQGQRSLGSKVRLETDGRTDVGDCIIPPVL